MVVKCKKNDEQKTALLNIKLPNQIVFLFGECALNKTALSTDWRWVTHRFLWVFPYEWIQKLLCNFQHLWFRWTHWRNVHNLREKEGSGYTLMIYYWTLSHWIWLLSLNCEKPQTNVQKLATEGLISAKKTLHNKCNWTNLERQHYL